MDKGRGIFTAKEAGYYHLTFNAMLWYGWTGKHFRSKDPLPTLVTGFHGAPPALLLFSNMQKNFNVIIVTHFRKGNQGCV